MRCPTDKQCPKSHYNLKSDKRPYCQRYDSYKKDITIPSYKIYPIDKSIYPDLQKEMTPIISKELEKQWKRQQKKIIKRNDKLINDIEKAHKQSGKSKLVFKGKLNEN